MSAKIIRPLDFQVTPEAFERSIEIHEHHGAFQEGPHPDFEDDECEDAEDFDCGETDDGYCQYAGSEWCDFECPYRS